jgi:hypothetical protein
MRRTTRTRRRDEGEKRKRLFRAAVNSVTGETNAQRQAAKQANYTSFTPQQLVALLTALNVVVGSGASRQLKPSSQWSAQQLSDIVKFYRGRQELVISRLGYAGDEEAYGIEGRLAAELVNSLSAAAEGDADMAGQFDPFIIAVQDWGPVYGGLVNRVNGVTNEPGSAANPSLLHGGQPIGDDRGINQTWAQRMNVLDGMLGGPGQAGGANARGSPTGTTTSPSCR